MPGSTPSHPTSPASHRPGGAMTSMPGMTAGHHTSGHMGGMRMGGMTMQGPAWMPTRPPTLDRLLAWHPQPIPVAVIVLVLLGVGYGYGYLRLRRRGDRWPFWRVVAWYVGVLSALFMTGTGINGYSMELLSVHMVQHMVLSMFSPILMLVGAPMTLLLRALPVAGAGRRGPRELLVELIHSRFARVVTSEFFTLPLFIASLYGLYFTPLFDALMKTWWGHELMLLHFLLVGLLFFYRILGVDPLPNERRPMFAVLELFGGMPFHAFFGIAVMMSTGLIVNTYDHVPAGWSVSPLSDQRTAGALAWAFSEIPTMIVLLVVFAGWRRSEARVARRGDRAEERDNDAELAAYNAYLADLSTRGRVRVEEPATVMAGGSLRRGPAPRNRSTTSSEAGTSEGDTGRSPREG